MEIVKVVVVADPFFVAELFVEVVDEDSSSSESFRFRICFLSSLFTFPFIIISAWSSPCETGVEAGAAREVEVVMSPCSVSL